MKNIVCLVVFFLFFVFLAVAQEDAVQPVQQTGMTLREMISAGGMLMYVLAAL